MYLFSLLLCIYLTRERACSNTEALFLAERGYEVSERSGITVELCWKISGNLIGRSNSSSDWLRSDRDFKYAWAGDRAAGYACSPRTGHEHQNQVAAPLRSRTLR